MRSMIEEITQAETDAVRIRQEAVSSAKDAVQKARAKIAEDDVLFEENEREALRRALEKAEVEGAASAEQSSENIKKDAEEVCKAARSKLPQAIDYILGKVRDSV